MVNFREMSLMNNRKTEILAEWSWKQLMGLKTDMVLDSNWTIVSCALAVWDWSYRATKGRTRWVSDDFRDEKTEERTAGVT